MHLHIYFPGNSILNKNELVEFSEMFKKNDLEYYAHEWAHWSDETLEFDLERELKTAATELMKFEGVQEYSIYAKSLGTYFACEFISSMIVQPSNLFLMGIPTGMGEERSAAYAPALKRSNSKIHIIQNQNDPFGKPEEVRLMLDGVEYKEILRKQDDHIYNCAEEVMEIVNS